MAVKRGALHCNVQDLCVCSVRHINIFFFSLYVTVVMACTSIDGNRYANINKVFITF